MPPQTIAANADLPFVEYLDNPKLKKFIRRVPPGEYLFKQGDQGDTMLIIADGTVWLTAEKEGQEHVVAILGRGQFLGEKAVMEAKSHQRFFSAKAKTHAMVLELRLEDVDMIYNTMPEIMIDILRRMFRIAAHRLDRANQLARLLRASDNVERLVHLLIYFASSAGRKVQGGKEFLLTPDSISFHIDMAPNLISACLTELRRRKLLKPVVNDYFIIQDEQALVASIPSLRQYVEGILDGANDGDSGSGLFGFFRRR